MKDEDAWAAELADVKPLGQKGSDRAPIKRIPLQPDAPAPVADTRQPGNTVPPLIISHNEAVLLAGHAQGVDGKLMKDLGKGKFAFTARLDLHGFYEGDAWMACMDFLHECAHAGHRCVLIIHGKGKGWGPKGDMGVIKSQVAGWLAHHPKVLAFHTAIPRDGGAGAVYVYMRRNRQAEG